MLDPLEAVKHSKREDGPYCTISGNEPSSVTLFPIDFLLSYYTIYFLISMTISKHCAGYLSLVFLKYFYQVFKIKHVQQLSLKQSREALHKTWWGANRVTNTYLMYE